MTADYNQQRSGQDRRQSGDSHCEVHVKNSDAIEQNTIDLASIKSGNAMIKWIMAATLPCLVAFMAYSSQTAASDRQELKVEVAQIKALLSGGLTSDAVIRAEIESIKRDIQDLKEHRK